MVLTGKMVMMRLINFIADVAQLVEHLICNQTVVGSNPIIGSGPTGIDWYCLISKCNEV